MAPIVLRRLLPLLLLLPALALPPAVAHALSEAERRAKARELEQLQQRLEALRAERDAVRSRYDRDQKALREVERRIGRTVRELKRLERKLQARRKRLRNLRRQEQALQRKLATQRDLLARQVRAAWMIGNQEYLKLLLNQEDPARLGRVMAYYRYFNAARSRRIDAVRDTLAELERIAGEVRTETARLETLRTRTLERQQALRADRRKRRAVVARLKAELRDREQAIGRLQENERQLRAVLEAIESSLSDLLADTGMERPFASYRGKLPWPVKGKVQKLYGKARQRSDLKWNGVRILAREGRTVRAIARGRVAYADWLRGYGLLLIIDHGDGYMSLYGQNQSLFKEVGDWVEAGEPIAAVGRSGGQERSALYFEIRHNGKPTNPVRWCSTAALARR